MREYEASKGERSLRTRYSILDAIPIEEQPLLNEHQARKASNQSNTHQYYNLKSRASSFPNILNSNRIIILNPSHRTSTHHSALPLRRGGTATEIQNKLSERPRGWKERSRIRQTKNEAQITSLEHPAGPSFLRVRQKTVQTENSPD